MVDRVDTKCRANDRSRWTCPTAISPKPNHSKGPQQTHRQTRADQFHACCGTSSAERPDAASCLTRRHQPTSRTASASVVMSLAASESMIGSSSVASPARSSVSLSASPPPTAIDDVLTGRKTYNGIRSQPTKLITVHSTGLNQTPHPTHARQALLHSNQPQCCNDVVS